MRKIRIPIILLFTLSVLSGCFNDKNKIDTSKIKIDINFIRINELNSLNENASKDFISRQRLKFGTFFDIYNTKILNLPSSYHPNYGLHLYNLNLDINFKSLVKSVDKEYPNVEFIKQDVTEAFKRYKYCFPKASTPDTILTYVSNLNQSVVTTERHIGVGLDKYLGNNREFYNKSNVAQYLQYRMNRQFIAPDIVMGWLMKDFPIDYKKNNILGHILYYGKLFYLLDALLPNADDSILLYYTDNQYDWCVRNEADIWDFVVNCNALFSTSKNDYRIFIGESPYTVGMPSDSPGRLGHWLGWRIVKAFMNRNPEIDLRELMNEKDDRKILRLSKYNP